MAPSSNAEVLTDPMKQKFVDILKANGVHEEVDRLTMTEPPELKGEHMASCSVYVLVEFKDPAVKPKNLFVKKFTSNAAHTQFTKQMRIMEKESAFFNDFLPIAREFCKGYKGCENLLDFFPKCLYGDDEMVVLENLVLDDTFIMLSKEAKQDLFTAKYVLSNLAKFHAASFALVNEAGGVDAFRKEWDLICFEAFLSDNNPMLAQMLDNGVSTCMNVLRGHPVDGDEEAIATLQGFLEMKVCPFVQSLLPTKPEDKIVVVNHGDCWNNNMLFKLDPKTGKVNDHIFVDLQITRLGSPNLDIGYLLYTSVKPAIRRSHLKELLQHYLDTFSETVALFHLKCPVSFEEFFQDYKEKSQMGFFINIMIIAAIGAFKDFDIENMTEDPVEMVEMMNNAINNWMKNNPETTAEISNEIVAVLKEHATLKP